MAAKKIEHMYCKRIKQCEIKTCKIENALKQENTFTE